LAAIRFRTVRDAHGTAAMDDLTLLLAAILAFSLFFSALASSFVARSTADRGERLQEGADALLAAVIRDPRWTEGAGRLVAERLDGTTEEDLAGLAANHPFRVTVWDLATDDRWTFESDRGTGDWRTALTSGNVLSDRVDPARITATVWE